MIPLRKVLQSMEKGLQSLTEKTQEMQKMLDLLEGALTKEKTRPGPKAKKRPSKKGLQEKGLRKRLWLKKCRPKKRLQPILF